MKRQGFVPRLRQRNATSDFVNADDVVLIIVPLRDSSDTAGNAAR
jgi:hypothetical protein